MGNAGNYEARRLMGRCDVQKWHLLPLQIKQLMSTFTLSQLPADINVLNARTSVDAHESTDTCLYALGEQD